MKNKTQRCLPSLALTLVLSLGLGCGAPSEEESLDENPFLAQAKEDTEYQNPDGIEVEVDLEGDVEGSPYLLSMGPASVGQFAMTYLRKRGQFYLESLAEDASNEERVEWLVDENWITAAQAKSVAPEKLRHFRLRAVNAVLLHGAAKDVFTGKVFTAKVPFNPFNVMAELGDSCADPDGHLGLDQSIYWYMWNPDRQSCKATLQEMTITVARLLPSQNIVYPEYDQLVADGKITAVILFGKINDGPITEHDIGMVTFKRVARWLQDAGYQEIVPAPLGRRFSKDIRGTTFEIDLYSPHEFSGLGDVLHFSNFQKAISEHEIVTYDGHSMLGASDFWSRPTYPSFYQIFVYGGCLGYEYYIQPIFKGKGSSWDKVDIISSTVEVSVGADRIAGPLLAKVAWALENGFKASWRDIMLDIKSKVYDSTFGVSGVRENRFQP